MIERLLIENVWFAITLGVIAYATNYYLALKEIFLYHAGAKDYVIFQDIYDLKTILPELTAKRRRINTQLLTGVLLCAIGTGVTWLICIQQYNRPDVFSALMGGLILLEAARIMRRVRNIVLFRDAPNGKALKGKVEYSPRIAHTLFYVEMYSFAALYLLLFFTTASWLFFGGAATCFLAGHRERDWTVVKT